jgi:RNA polymerase sigma factor (sigma-70 family)
VGADTTDHALVGAARAGDERAFEALYQRYQRRIATYVQGMVRDHGRAEDITQEVFMSALRRMRSNEAEIAFKPWIYEIAKNACIDAFRRSRRAEIVSFDADDGAERLGGVDAAPDTALDTRVKLDNLRGAFDGLSDAHHQILVMRELGGLSYREIGERMGMSRPAVESTLFRARRRLAEEYDELVSGKRCLRVQAIIAGSGDGRVGVRDERRMARHVSHCQPCRREAAAAGFDVATLARRTVRAKVAALLPLPGFLKRWLGGADGGAGLVAGHGGTVGALAQYAEPTWAKAAAVAATLAMAGLGAGVATRDGGSPSSHHPPAVAPAAVPPAKASGATRAPTAGAGAQPARHGSPAHRSGRGSGGGSPSAPSTSSGAGDGSSPATTHQPGGSSPAAASSTGADAKQAASGAGDTGGQSHSPQPKPKTTTTGTGSSAPIQTPSAPDTGQVVGGVTKTVDNTAGGVTDTVNRTLDGTTGAVDQTTHALTDTVDQATGGSLQGATDAVQGTLDATTGAVRNTAHDATGTVDQTVHGVTGLLGGGGGGG